MSDANEQRNIKVDKAYEFLGVNFHPTVPEVLRVAVMRDHLSDMDFARILTSAYRGWELTRKKVLLQKDKKNKKETRVIMHELTAMLNEVRKSVLVATDEQVLMGLLMDITYSIAEHLYITPPYKRRMYRRAIEREFGPEQRILQGEIEEVERMMLRQYTEAVADSLDPIYPEEITAGYIQGGEDLAEVLMYHDYYLVHVNKEALEGRINEICTAVGEKFKKDEEFYGVDLYKFGAQKLAEGDRMKKEFDLIPVLYNRVEAIGELMKSNLKIKPKDKALIESGMNKIIEAIGRHHDLIISIKE